MAKLTFYGGVDEIGGNKILLEEGNTKVFLDFGMSFSEEGKFFEFQELLFENQESWIPPNSTPTRNFTQYAEELGLDIVQFNRQSRSSLIKDKVRGEYEEARGLGLTGTPTFFLNGQKMNITTYQDFKAQVAAAVNPSVEFGAGIVPSDTDTKTAVSQ